MAELRIQLALCRRSLAEPHGLRHDDVLSNAVERAQDSGGGIRFFHTGCGFCLEIGHVLKGRFLDLT